MEFELVVSALGGVSASARVFTQRARVGLVVIAKATFNLVPGGTMTLAVPRPIVTAEVASGSGIVTSAKRASDVALFVSRAEMIVDGVAFSGVPVEEMRVGIGLHRAGQPLLSKELRILGDRAAMGSPPTPFRSMPIVYERAFGGIGRPENPVGVGTDGDGLPNILPAVGDPAAAAGPSGFGPISSAWPSRRPKRGVIPRPTIDEAPWVSLPDDFSDSYFQAAPADQAIPELAPGDTLSFAGLHPDHPKLWSHLARMRAVAMLEMSHRRRAPLGLRLDTLTITPHELVAELTFRGVTVVVPDMLAGLNVAAAVEELDRPFTWPEDLSAVAAERRTIRNPTQADRAGPPSSGTLLMSPGGAPDKLGTMLVADAPSSRTLPFQKQTGPAPSPRPRVDVVVPAQVVPASPDMNFTLAIPTESPPVRPVAAPAPASAPSPPVERSVPAPVETHVAPPEVPAVPPASAGPSEAPAVTAPKPPKSKEEVWGRAEPAAPQPPPPAAPPAPRPAVQPSADRSAGLYKKFKT